ncbi:retrotransposon protein, putative, ty1-copia subclass [Tanacetum coccineum]
MVGGDPLFIGAENCQSVNGGGSTIGDKVEENGEFLPVQQRAGVPLDSIYSSISTSPIAAASLGQVYKDKFKYSEQHVAVKVIRKKSLSRVELCIGVCKEGHRRLKAIRGEMKRMQNVPYASAVGSIMYAVRCTRPDVAFAQNITSRFQQNPGEAHWTAVKNILKYLRNTKDTFLVYGGNPEAELQVKCYCDAGFETDRDDTKSQTGYVFVLNGGAVVWKSSKQSTTAQHATEAEYIAASEAAKEAVWIRKFIDELGVVPSNDYSIKMNYDNFSAIIIAKELGIQKGVKHFQRKYHYVREYIETGEIDIVKVHTDDNLADPFMKALAGPKLTRHARSMGLRPASSFM